MPRVERARLKRIVAPTMGKQTESGRKTRESGAEVFHDDGAPASEGK